MPTVTSSRSDTSGRISYTFKLNGAKVDGGVVAIDPWSQTTTSWRTGGQWLSPDQQYEDMTGEQLRSHIREEYARAYDTGHEFQTTKISELQATRNASIEQHPSSNGVSYYGPILINLGAIEPLGGPTQSSYLPDATKVRVDGTKLWAQAVPTASAVSLASFLGELKEGLPQLPGKTSMAGKPPADATAGEYLNWKFGIKPLKSDLQKIANGVIEFSKRVDQYRRDSGRNVRRRRSFETERQYVEILNGTAIGKVYIPMLFGNADVFTTQLYSSPGRLSVVDVIERQTSFAGAFTYYLDQGDDLLSKLSRYEQLANHALSTQYDLDTAWQLAPWSWLVDWFSDVGSIIKNLTALGNDNVVARYAYVMHHTKVTRMYSVTGMTLRSGVTGPTEAHCFRTQESKKRTAATPYGFGVSMANLSLSQIAILGALGISKSPGVLH